MIGSKHYEHDCPSATLTGTGITSNLQVESLKHLQLDSANVRELCVHAF